MSQRSEIYACYGCYDTNVMLAIKIVPINSSSSADRVKGTKDPKTLSECYQQK